MTQSSSVIDDKNDGKLSSAAGLCVRGSSALRLRAVDRFSPLTVRLDDEGRNDVLRRRRVPNTDLLTGDEGTEDVPSTVFSVRLTGALRLLSCASTAANKASDTPLPATELELEHNPPFIVLSTFWTSSAVLPSVSLLLHVAKSGCGLTASLSV